MQGRNVFDNQVLSHLQRRTSVKWKAYSPEVLPLWVAEMDVEIAPEIVAAVSKAMETGDTGYPSGNSYEQAFQEFALRQWVVEIDEKQLARVPDVMQGMLIAQQLFSSVAVNDAPVAIIEPVYPQFRRYLTESGYQVVAASASETGRIDFAELERVFREAKPSTLWLCNPHNPTGAAHSEAELIRLLDLANRYRVRLVSDEIHAPLGVTSFESAVATVTPLITLQTDVPVISVTSASKAFNLAGFKAALLVFNEAALSVKGQISKLVADGVGSVSLLAQTEAFKHGDDWLALVRTSLQEQRQFFAELLELHLPALKINPADASYLAWVDCRGIQSKLAGKAVGKFFLENAKVAFNEGSHFGAPGNGFIRVNLATSKSILEDAVLRMKTALSQVS